jgi:polysaccharide export outer membrane protein
MLLAALVAALGLALGGGCQVSMGPSAQSNCGSCGTCGNGQGPGPGYRPGNGGYLPGGIQQTGYGEPGGPAMPGGPGCMGGPCMGGPGMGGPGMGGPGMPGFDGGPGPIPREINKVSLPPYTVAPPDILFIDAARLVPKPPYKIEPLEVIAIEVTKTLPGEPIKGLFVVSPEGTLNLGFAYGSVRVQGLTIEQIQSAVTTHLGKVLQGHGVTVSLAQFRGQQQIRGEHLVRPDGTISLGAYGSVYVAGMTLGQVKCVIEKHLEQWVASPQVAVDVYAYNSQWYYVIFDGAGYGQQVYRLPITGNETVLDAISNLQGMPPQGSLHRVWIARPAPCGHPCDQILMVDWLAVTLGGSTCTNYQLFPGDRVFVDSDCFVKADGWLAKVLAPINRILGTLLLYAEVRDSFRGNNNGGVAFVAPIR